MLLLKYLVKTSFLFRPIVLTSGLMRTGPASFLVPQLPPAAVEVARPDPKWAVAKDSQTPKPAAKEQADDAMKVEQPSAVRQSDRKNEGQQENEPQQLNYSSLQVDITLKSTLQVGLPATILHAETTPISQKVKLETSDVMKKMNSLLFQRATERSLHSINLKRNLKGSVSKSKQLRRSARKPTSRENSSTDYEATQKRLKMLQKAHRARLTQIERLAAQTARMALSMPSGRDFMHSFAKKNNGGNISKAKSILIERAVVKARKEEIKRMLSAKQSRIKEAIHKDKKLDL